MVLTTYLTPKQEGEEDIEEYHGDGHVLSLFPKMQDVVCEVLLTVEGLIEPKAKDSLQDFLPELSSVQVSPKVGKDFMGQLKDPWESCSIEQILSMTW